jgi:MFS transporter, ACS family, tartrate transporter
MASSVAALQGPWLQSGLRKARWRLIPLLGICYLVSYMDRANISFAAETMNRDLHFTAKIYGLGAGLFFLPYALFEIPSNRLLLRFGARRWIARIMLTWGLLAACMIAIRTPWSFYGLRMLLGLAEAGFFPGALFYLSQWFPVNERARAISLFYMAYPLSNVVMGGLAGLLLKQNGRLGLAGWQWLFLLEALPAVALSVVVWFGLPDSPAKAGWLTGEEREALAEELASDPVHKLKTHGSALRTALRSKHLWGVAVFQFLTLGTSYALAFSLPLVLRGATGWSPGKVGGIVAVFGVLGAAGMVSGAMHSDRTGERKLHIVVPAVALGLCLLVAGGLGLAGWGAVAALAVAVVSYCSMQGPILSVPSMVLSGEAAAVGIAAMNMFAILGGFVGPYWMGWMHDATGGYAWGIGALCVPCLLAAGIAWQMLKVRNREAIG